MSKRILLPIAILFIFSFALPPKNKIKVWLIGDSTMAIKDTKAYPETGWGMPFIYFFDSTVTIDNRAKNGRSTKSFIAEGLWTPVMANMSEDDFVFIQFGHNDEGKDKVGRYSTPDEFKANLTRYVTDTRNKRGIPVLVTPVARRTFDSIGKIRESHPVYTEAVIEVAKKQNVPLIDLNRKSQQLLQDLGAEHSKLLFLHVAKDEHPNYPEGKKDDTHFSELGARKMAQLVLADIKALNLELAERIVNRK